MANNNLLQIPSYSYDDLQAILDSDLDCFPTSLYNLQALTAPMSTESFNNNFGADVNTIGNSILKAVPGQSTNFIVANTVECPFLMMWLRVVFVTEMSTFGIAGASDPSPSAGAPGAVPTFDGTFPAGTALDPATFEFGQATQRAVQAWLESNMFTLQLGCRFPVVQTSLARVGCILSDSEFCGYGDQLSSVALRVNQANAQAKALSRTDRFIWQNTMGALTEAVGIGAPMARAAFGGPCISSGAADSWYAVRGGMGILLTKDTTIQAQIQQDQGASIYQDRLRQELTDDASTITPSAEYTAVTAGGLKCGVKQFKLGNLRVGIEFKGCELTPRACFDWALRYGRDYSKLYQDILQPMSGPMLRRAGFNSMGEAFEKVPTKNVGEFLKAKGLGVGATIENA